MQVRYVGPSQEVEIAATGQTATRLKPLEVDDAIAKRLLKQDTWEAASDKTTNKDKE